ncbi:sigma-54 dependent transcriptional regulator [Marinospirillum sp.]|uniref:sigma-54 interaction domain-containing protein n=1 Tax=Marinospirillum sp. TaxID=2183934 RepID=UPI0028707BB6|nr:sigma-54 dependent transcriptional regulator [Marinospirillum sp.]MDR9468266.1 sigma-54 dependent transcriptional regulator [Marinospirillum sp.]
MTPSSSAEHPLVGQSQVMQQLFQQLNVVAKAQGPVLIHGETGTGKELVAKALHQQSSRASQPFLAVNCAGIPQELLESEFFGHAAGAFTGANKARKGLFVEANGGSLLLDEIGEMPLSLQAKLLRALQDGSIRPVGQDTEEKVDVRIIAATHRDLKKKVETGEFREDLYYRLETFALHLPPLKARGADKLLLAQSLLEKFCHEQQRSLPDFSLEARQLLENYDYPGNIRELQNILERALAFCNEPRIEAWHLPERLKTTREEEATQKEQNRNQEVEQRLLEGNKLPTLDQLQQRYVRLILEETAGNKRRTAALLGIGRRTLYRWLDEEKNP